MTAEFIEGGFTTLIVEFLVGVESGVGEGVVGDYGCGGVGGVGLPGREAAGEIGHCVNGYRSRVGLDEI